jgi:signal transduction histidine kinase
MFTMLGLDPAIGAIAGYDAYLAALPQEDQKVFFEQAVALTFNEGLYRMEHRVLLPDGSLRWLRVHGRIDRDEAGSVTRVAGFAQDTTIEHQTADAVARLNEKLEESVALRTAELEYAVKELSTLSYAISHDLRQPLRAITGYLSLMSEEVGGTLSPTVRDYLDRVQTSVRRMDATIDAMLSLSRLTRATVHRGDLDATAIAREAATEVAVAEPTRSVDWQIEADLRLHADPGLFRIVLHNLLGNAFKFTRGKDAPRIAFGRARIDGVDVLFVRDNGAGFDAASARRLFQPFERMHHAEEFEGTGIGLATVSRILQRHGGWIRAESTRGHGAAFYFVLGTSEERPEAIPLRRPGGHDVSAAESTLRQCDEPLLIRPHDPA